jgi:hypothetical protein
MRTSAGTCVVLPVLSSWATVGQLASVELPIWGYLFCGKPRVSSVTPLGPSLRNSRAVTAHNAGLTSRQGQSPRLTGRPGGGIMCPSSSRRASRWSSHVRTASYESTRAEPGSARTSRQPAARGAAAAAGNSAHWSPAGGQGSWRTPGAGRCPPHHPDRSWGSRQDAAGHARSRGDGWRVC